MILLFLAGAALYLTIFSTLKVSDTETSIVAGLLTTTIVLKRTPSCPRIDRMDLDIEYMDYSPEGAHTLSVLRYL